MDKIIDIIVEKEWLMFSTTQNVGGQASCQQNRPQFEVMRRAQFGNWDSDSLSAYLADIEKAEAEGANLPTLKYAYMMESTDPVAYHGIAHLLPAHSEEKLAIVDELVAMTVVWCEEFAEHWPGVASMGRPLRKSGDSPFATSVETYARGELLSYGEETLRRLRKHYRAMAEAGVNLHERVVESEMRLMGLQSLAHAEKLVKKA